MTVLVMVGEVFGRLTIINEVEQIHNRRTFMCKCSCGNFKIVKLKDLRNGHTQSCGCYYIDSRTKHGLYKSSEYAAYYGMLSRCTDKKNEEYHNYGERGIGVCPDWSDKETGFINFYRDMGKKPTSKHSIDRINNNGNYCKENCKWSTSIEQNRNFRRNKIITYNGESHCVVEWAEIIGIDKSTLASRLGRYNWSIERALTTPVKRKER